MQREEQVKISSVISDYILNILISVNPIDNSATDVEIARVKAETAKEIRKLIEQKLGYELYNY